MSSSALDACWRRIGIQGDNTCPELSRHIHCRRCPVFVEAAEAFLDRDLPGDYLSSWARHFAAPDSGVAARSGSVVVFRIGPEKLGLPTALFTEVVGVSRVHSMPHRRGRVLRGIVGVRGTLLPCVDLGALLGLSSGSPPAAHRLSRLCVVRHDGLEVALPVDEVVGTVAYQQGDLQERSATMVSDGASHTKAFLTLPDGAVGLLDAGSIFQAIRRGIA